MKSDIDLRTLVDYAREERKMLADYYPLPSPVDCIRYAITEMAEYDDALLREERAGDKRNNDRQRDAMKELGQAGEMICAEMIQSQEDIYHDPLVPFVPSSEIAGVLYAEVVRYLVDALPLVWTKRLYGHKLVMALFRWVQLCWVHEQDPMLLLEQRYADVWEKWGVKTEITVGEDAQGFKAEDVGRRGAGELVVVLTEDDLREIERGLSEKLDGGEGDDD